MRRLRLSSSLLLSAVADGYLVYDVRTAQLHRFNPIAALVAELCIGGRSIAQIKQDLSSSIPECDWTSCAAWIDAALTAGALTKLASELREADRVAAAYVCQQHASQLAPDRPDVWRELGELAHIMDSRGEAREAYQRYDQLRPGDAEVGHLLVALQDGPAPARVSAARGPNLMYSTWDADGTCRRAAQVACASPGSEWTCRNRWLRSRGAEGRTTRCT